MSVEIYTKDHEAVGIASNGILRWDREMVGEAREAFLTWCRANPDEVLPTDDGTRTAGDVLAYVDDAKEPYTDGDFVDALHRYGRL